MKSLCCGVLLLAALSGRAQAVRYSTQGHLPIESQPAPGYEQPAYLGMGDSVRVLGPTGGSVPSTISAAMRGQFVRVSYPAYRGQPAGQGYVLRRGLVSTADSLLLNIPATAGQTVSTSTTTVTTTRRYVSTPPAGNSPKAPRPTTKAQPKPVHP